MPNPICACATACDPGVILNASRSEGDNCLSSVLGTCYAAEIVLYNGGPRWNAALFLIESQRTPEGLHNALNRVLKWQNAEKQQSLSSAIAKLAHRVLRKRMPHIPMLDGITDLRGVVSMLAENIDTMVLERYQAGKVEGEATMFKAMLASRFGPLPNWANHQIAGATSAQLLAWGEQLFTASSLEQLFQQA